MLLPWRKQLLAQRRRLAASQPWLARIHRLVALTQYERAMPWLDKLTGKAEQHLPMDDMQLLLQVGVRVRCHSQVCKEFYTVFAAVTLGMARFEPRGSRAGPTHSSLHSNCS